MKKVILILGTALLTVMMCSSFGQSPKEVSIGSQVWMVENLNVDKFRNGEPVPQAKSAEEWKLAGDNKQAAWCYYNNKAANGEKYGKLYNWYAVNDTRGLAPAGWHIPSVEEWKALEDYLGGYQEAGNKMKTSSGWKKDSKIGGGSGTNESGFSGLPGGIRYYHVTFDQLGFGGDWWSSTEGGKTFESDAMTVGLGYLSGQSLSGGGSLKENGLSVRCVRD